MNFNYQLYVNRLSYEPNQWPPDISLAELHSRVSEQGPINQNGVKCPCCSYQSKLKFKGWFWNDIGEYCRERGLGSSIPAYFGLLKYYILAIFIVICINGIYPIWAMYFTCQTPDIIRNPQQSCLRLGVIDYLDFDLQLAILDLNGYGQIVKNLIILQTVTFYFLMFVNLSSIWYLYYMQKAEEKSHLEHIQASKNALIVGNINVVDVEKLKEKLNLNTKLDIVEMIPLKEVKKYFELISRRNAVYYKLLSKYVQSEDPKSQKKLNKTLSDIQKQLKIQKQIIISPNYSNLLVIFKTPYMSSLVNNNYSLTAFNKLRYGTKSLLIEAGLSKQQVSLPIYTLKVPSVKQIRWENVGEDIRTKLSGRLKSFFIAIGIILFLLFFFEEPLRYSLKTHTSDPKNLTIIQKLFPIILSFLLFAVSVLYRNYMVDVSKKRNPLNEYQASKFVLISSMIFHIIFYIVIPVVFFSVDDGIDSTVKLFVISEQARTFIVMQLILCMIDIPYQMWKAKKTKSLSDQRQGFKYNQKMLHKLVQYRDFPLELRLQVMFRIWSLAMFYSFYLPYILYYMLVALSILYFLEKRNFFLHYTLRRTISLKLQKSFLMYFINFFCLFQCFSYALNAKQSWMVYTSISITLALLLLNFIFWIIVQPSLQKYFRSAEELQQNLLSNLISSTIGKNNNADYALQYAQGIADQYREGYKKFIETIINDKLDEEVDEYISSLKLDVDQKAHAPSVQKLIEMAQSQFDEITQD